MRTLSARAEQWPLAREFRISRATKTAALVVVVELGEDGIAGRGECLPYPRYGETPDSVIAAIEAMRGALAGGVDRVELQEAMGPGAARNAIDAALIDLECKASGRRAWDVLGIDAPEPVVTAYTIGMDRPAAMAEEAARHRRRRLLKLKLGARDAVDCVRAVREAAPESELIVDANEAWTLAALEAALPALVDSGVAMIEQPLPAGADADLGRIGSPIPLGADESVHTRDGLEELAARYDVVNIKLDKTGGVTEALALERRAADLGLTVMVGCMVATSLSMAPAMLLTAGARFVDLDGPLLLAQDREPGLEYRDDRVFPPTPALWG